MVKKRFSTFYIANKPFWTTKTSVSKTHKIGIFPKGLVHGFDQKVGNFVNNSFYAKYTQREVFAEVLVRNQAFLDNKNMDLKRRQNWPFFKGDSPFGQKVEVFLSFVFIKNRSRFLPLWFWCKIDQEKVSGKRSSLKKVCIILCNPLSLLVAPCNPL